MTDNQDYGDSRPDEFMRSLLDGDVQSAIEKALQGHSAGRDVLADPRAFLDSAGLDVPEGIRIGSEERELLDLDREFVPPDLFDRRPPVRWICITFCRPRRRDLFFFERCVRICFLG